jgi:tyrosine-protein phosphatase YwqE
MSKAVIVIVTAAVSSITTLVATKKEARSAFKNAGKEIKDTLKKLAGGIRDACK